MPYCEVVLEHEGPESPDTELKNVGVKIFYRTYGHGPTKVLLIIGLAGTHDSWNPQIKGLTGTTKPNDGGTIAVADDETTGGIEVCAFDNRGMGRSSVLSKRSEYTSKIMAKDAIALLDHLGWKRAHIVGHSMGAMIACTLAGMVPERVLSLALLNVTGGGFECFPKLDLQTFSIAMRFLKAKTPEQRASVDLDTHYSKDYLDERIGTNTRREILYERYVEGISATGMQSTYGFRGQVNACWLHKLTKTEIDVIRAAGFLVSVIHGRYDVIAQICYARRLAQKLYPISRMVDLHGGHLVSHERALEVNEALLELIKASEMKTNTNDWTNLVMEDPGYVMKRISLIRSSSEGRSVAFLAYSAVEKFHHFLLFLFGLFLLAFGYARRAFEVVNTVKVTYLLSPHQRVSPDQQGGSSSKLELIQV